MTGRPPNSRIFEATDDPVWRLEASGDDPLRESRRQSRFAISNGFLGVRGERASTRGECRMTPSKTSVAGLFSTSDEPDAVPRLIPAPDWLQVRLLLPAGPVIHGAGDASSHHMYLDLKRGLLLVDCHHESADASLRVRELRLVSADQRAIGLQRIQFRVLEGDINIRLEAEVAGAEASLIVDHETPDLVVWRTRRSTKMLAMAVSASITIDGVVVVPTPIGPLGWSWTWCGRPGQVVEFERLVAFGRDQPREADAAATAQANLRTAMSLDSNGVLERHQAAWEHRWASSDIEIDGDPAAQQALRVAAYHLNGAANPDDERVSIAACALTGEDYAGHEFWDTEIFLLPFYCLTWPEAARALLMYRFHTLDGARAKAKRLGWRAPAGCRRRSWVTSDRTCCSPSAIM